jgi:hypothetical protein
VSDALWTGCIGLMSKWTKPLPWIWLVFMGTLALLSFYVPYRPQALAPTATFTGFLHFKAHGQLYIVQMREICGQVHCSVEVVTVYYVAAQQGLIQLVFGCAYPPCTSVSGYVSIAPGLQLMNSTEITAIGTLLVPSQWNSSNYEPALHFNGDLYVSEITY